MTVFPNGIPASPDPYHGIHQHLELFHLSFHLDGRVLRVALVAGLQSCQDWDDAHVLQWQRHDASREVPIAGRALNDADNLPSSMLLGQSVAFLFD